MGMGTLLAVSKVEAGMEREWVREEVERAREELECVWVEAEWVMMVRLEK